MTTVVTKDEAPTLADVSESLTVINAVSALTTEDESAAMSVAWKVLKQKKDDIEAYYKDKKADARKSWQNWIDQEKQVLEPLEQGLTHAAELMSAYTLAKQEADRVREAQERAAAHAAEQARVLDQAVALETVGKELDDPALVHEAEQMVQRAAVAQPLFTPARPAPRPSVGVQMEDFYTGSVTDIATALKTLLDHPEYFGVLEFKPGKLNDMAELFKENLAVKMPGFASTKGSRPRRTPGKRK